MEIEEKERREDSREGKRRVWEEKKAEDIEKQEKGRDERKRKRRR